MIQVLVPPPGKPCPVKGQSALYADGLTIGGIKHPGCDDASGTLVPKREEDPEERAYAPEGTVLGAAGDGLGSNQFSRRAAETSVGATLAALQRLFHREVDTLEEASTIAAAIREDVITAIGANVPTSPNVVASNGVLIPVGTLTTTIGSALNADISFAFAVGDFGVVVEYNDGTKRFYRGRWHNTGGPFSLGYAATQGGIQGWIDRCPANAFMSIEDGDGNVTKYSVEEGTQGVLFFVEDGVSVKAIYVLTDGFEKIGSSAEAKAMPWKQAMSGLTTIATVSNQAVQLLFRKLFGLIGSPGEWVSGKRKDVPHDDTTVVALMQAPSQAKSGLLGWF